MKFETAEITAAGGSKTFATAAMSAQGGQDFSGPVTSQSLPDLSPGREMGGIA